MSAPTISFRDSGLRWVWLAALVVLFDQLTKLWIVDAIPEGGSVYVLPILNIIHTYNPGAAWSMFADAGGAQRWVLSALAIVVSVMIVYSLRRMALATQTLMVTALTLILGGAVGNVIDRLRLGEVVDFVQVHWNDARFPAFNVADSAITIGAICVLLATLREAQHERRLKREAASSGK